MVDLSHHWNLDPEIAFLNHGSFGACPSSVLEEQQRLRSLLEREPVDFYVRELEGRLDAARAELAAFVNAPAEAVVFVPNATFAVNCVVSSLDLRPGDELLVTDHEYNACANALRHWAGRARARVVTATVPFPLRCPDEALEAVLAAITPRTRLALLDHVTSPTGLLLPVERLVAELKQRGVLTLIDGAHGVGLLPLDLQALGADFYTSNCHKWLCAPKTAALLYVAEEHRDKVRPVVISHGANATRTDRPRLWLEFDWIGTIDVTPYLCVPAAMRFLEGLLPGGVEVLRRRNHELALYARDRLCELLGIEPPCPDEMITAMASVPLPDGSPDPPRSSLYADALQEQLFRRGIEVPVVPWPAPPRRVLRVSAQAYNSPAQYDRLVAALAELL